MLHRRYIQLFLLKFGDGLLQFLNLRLPFLFPGTDMFIKRIAMLLSTEILDRSRLEWRLVRKYGLSAIDRA